MSTISANVIADDPELSFEVIPTVVLFAVW